MGISVAALTAQVQVNIPFSFLWAGYLERFLARGLNPEIGLDAFSLGHYPPGAFRRAARAFQGAGRRITLHGPFQDLAPGALDDGVLAASRRRLRQEKRGSRGISPRRGTPSASASERSRTESSR